MIHNILVYTQEGKILYSWEFEKGSLSLTNKILVPGFFSAISSVVKDIFQGRLQRIILEDKAIVISAKESFIQENLRWILISMTVDLIDNDKLIDSLIMQVLEIILNKLALDNEKLVFNSDLDEELNKFIQKKTYKRTNKKIVISSVFILVSMVISVLIYSYVRSFKYGLDNTNILSFISTIIAGFLFITPSSAISGSKRFSVIFGIIFSSFGSFIAYLIINDFLLKTPYFGGLGSPIVYFSFCILLGFTFSYLGGLITDRFYLN